MTEKTRGRGKRGDTYPGYMPPMSGAVDVGGTKIAAALFTREGEISAVTKTAIDPSGGDAAASQVAAAIDDLAAAASSTGRSLRAVGLCVPGIAYGASGKVWAPNIPGWDQYPLLEKIGRHARQGAGFERIREHVPLVRVPSSGPGRKRQGIPEEIPGHVPDVYVPLVLESDRSAYVAGEAWKGAAAGARDAVFLAVGTGIGAGIIAGGRILHGHEDIAGAVGWFGLDPDFKPEYAAMGSFEAEASGNSVARKARALLASGRRSLMRELAGGAVDAVTAETVAEAARRGDARARDVIAGAVTYLGMGIANIVSLLNPEVVVLGGGLFQAADLFLEPVRREFRRWAQPLAARSVRIELSALGERAGLYGCGYLAWRP
jgi:glucokinase